MGLEGTMTCEGCKRPTPVMDIKYMPKGNGRVAMCKDCLAKASGKSNAPVKEFKITSKQETALPKKATNGDAPRYYCKKCNYRFRSSSDNPVCGYCGRPDTIEPC